MKLRYFSPVQKKTTHFIVSSFKCSPFLYDTQCEISYINNVGVSYSLWVFVIKEMNLHIVLSYNSPQFTYSTQLQYGPRSKSEKVLTGNGYRCLLNFTKQGSRLSCSPSLSCFFGLP